MKLAIMQPYFFPYIGYFQLIKAVDKFVLYDNLNFINRGWVNRNRLLEVNKKPLYVTVPLKQKSSFQKIKEVEIDNTQKWQKKLLKLLYYNYRRSHYYEETYLLIEKILKDKEAETKLSKLNAFLIMSLCSYLDIKTDFNYDIQGYEKIEKEISSIGKESPAPNYSRMTARIIKICRLENAKVYVNAIGGVELYSKAAFAEEGIDLYFLNTLPFTYKQNANGFFKHLSIIDVLMNCGREETKRMLANCELV